MLYSSVTIAAAVEKTARTRMCSGEGRFPLRYSRQLLVGGIQGIRCPKPLLKGQFVDIYRGEIITVQEADRREAKNSRGKDSYLYTLDKFAADNEIDEEDLYVVDGEFVGGVTRFINHSCEPNCRQFTVSYNHADPKIYDLAFFAMENIPAFTELTFDYLDKEEDHEDEGAVDPGDRKDGEKPTKCLCGAESCRKYLWL
ncbi:MAG: hypothetical protein M1827_003304 [Pycnora praestabilis]|nr:MAG: hypothetical protein M1827_003304 [Pycnora praestabilis]